MEAWVAMCNIPCKVKPVNVFIPVKMAYTDHSTFWFRLQCYRKWRCRGATRSQSEDGSRKFGVQNAVLHDVRLTHS